MLLLLLFVGWQPSMFANTYLDSPQEPIPKAQSKTSTPKPPYILYEQKRKKKNLSREETFLGKKYSIALVCWVWSYTTKLIYSL